MDRSTRLAGPQNSARGQIAAEWLKVLAGAIGLSAAPLLAGSPAVMQALPWLAVRFWIVGLVLGALLAGVGAYLVARQRPKPAGLSTLAAQVLGVVSLKRREVILRVESSPPPPPAPAVLRTAAASAPPPGPAQEAAQPWLYLPGLTTAMGIFILLPAAIAILAQSQRLASPARTAAFFSAPAILLWMTAEVISFFYIEQSGLTGGARLLGRLAPAVQILSALAVWAYLGVSLGLQGVEWLLGVGAGLALLGAGLATAAAVAANRRTKA